jgi:uncharacterized membrane protein
MTTAEMSERHVAVVGASTRVAARVLRGIGTLDRAYVPPAIQKTELRRRPLSERSAT